VQKVHRQLDKVRRDKGMSLAALKRLSGLRCSVASISRKLAGKRRLTDREIVAFARALGIEVTHTVVTLGAAA
jgi:transcriptional regulator with XRE-family HTH domain